MVSDPRFEPIPTDWTIDEVKLDRGLPGASALIDLERYPIAHLAREQLQHLIEDCRSRLAVSGALVLPGFLTPGATTAMAMEGQQLDWAAHHYATDHTVYFDPSDDTLAENHPRRLRVRTDKGNVPYDLIPATSLLRQLYQWDGLLNFIAAVLGEPRLYRHGDPMAALNINAHGEGQELGWHFDRTEFAVTLSLQQSEAGGLFEYVPNLRGETHENYDGVARVIAGDRDGVITLPAEPGTLTLFRGHYSLHRVTPSRGPSKRLMAALSYVREPNVIFSAICAQPVLWPRHSVQRGGIDDHHADYPPGYQSRHGLHRVAWQRRGGSYRRLARWSGLPTAAPRSSN